jgi:Molybdate transporter of MFS superfamily
MSRELDSRRRRWRFLQGCSGACGDPGTFIPHVIGAMTVAGLAPAGVLFGFGVFLIGSGLFYGLPVPVQPMKAVSAVILTGGLRTGEVAGAGLVMGVLLLALGDNVGHGPARAAGHHCPAPRAPLLWSSVKVGDSPPISIFRPTLTFP